MDRPANRTTNAKLEESSQPIHTNDVRQREHLNREEEAGAELRLGDFQHVHTLSISEARLITDAIFQARKRMGKKHMETEALVKMQEYMDTYARFKSKPVLDELENLMNLHPELESFEKSQLTTLCPGDADEAKTLIPSIVDKISDVELQELLDEINEKRRMFVD